MRKIADLQLRTWRTKPSIRLPRDDAVQSGQAEENQAANDKLAWGWESDEPQNPIDEPITKGQAHG